MSDLIRSKATPLLKAFQVEDMEAVLEAASARLGRKDGFTTKKSFAPSSMGYGHGKCPRYWYYAFHGAEFVYTNTARERANMDAGTAAGERIAKLFAEAGILNSAEFKIINNDPPIFGYGDLAVTWQGEEMIGEVKTTKNEVFNIRAAKNAAPGYQMLQLLIYMRVMKKDKGFFVIENKNTHEFLVVPVRMTEERSAYIDEVFEWMRMVKKSSDEDKLPSRPFTPKSKECKSCPVWNVCWDGFVKTTAANEGSDPQPGVVDLPPLRVPE